MIEFFDVYVSGVRIDGVDDIVSPTEEKPSWLIKRKGKVVACASKGAKVEYRRVETPYNRRLRRLRPIEDSEK